MKIFFILIFFLFAMNTNAQSDIDDGSGALIKLVCKYTDPQYPSFKVIIERENGRAMFGILHGKAILKKKKTNRIWIR